MKAVAVRIPWKKSCSVLMALMLLFPCVSWAFDAANYKLSALFPEIQYLGKTIQIPKNSGNVQAAFQGQAKTILCIQDLHCNYEVQKNIAQIIGYVAREHGLKLVGEEGAAGRVKVDVLKDFPLPAVRSEVSDYFIKQGRLTGAEAAAAGPAPITLEGIETQSLYDSSLKNVRAFMTTEVQGYIADLRDGLESLKPGLYTPALLAHDAQCLSWREGRLDLLRFCLYLQQQASQHNLVTTGWAQLAAFVKGANSVNLEQVCRDAMGLDSALRQMLYTDPVQAELDKCWQRLDVMEKLLNISATPGEVKEFREHRVEFGVRPMADFIQAHAREDGVETNPEVFALDEHLKAAEAFYQLADQRSVCFVDNLLARMDADKENLAVMINGGFHSEGIAEELKRRNVSFLSIQPCITQPNVVNPYFSLLQGKELPLEKLLEKNQSVLAVPSLPGTNPRKFDALAEINLKAIARTLKMTDKELREFQEFVRNHNLINLDLETQTQGCFLLTAQNLDGQNIYILVAEKGNMAEANVLEHSGVYAGIGSRGIAYFEGDATHRSQVLNAVVEKQTTFAGKFNLWWADYVRGIRVAPKLETPADIRNAPWQFLFGQHRFKSWYERLVKFPIRLAGLGFILFGGPVVILASIGALAWGITHDPLQAVVSVGAVLVAARIFRDQSDAIRDQLTEWLHAGFNLNPLAQLQADKRPVDGNKAQVQQPDRDIAARLVYWIGAFIQYARTHQWKNITKLLIALLAFDPAVDLAANPIHAPEFNLQAEEDFQTFYKKNQPKAEHNLAVIEYFEALARGDYEYFISRLEKKPGFFEELSYRKDLARMRRSFLGLNSDQQLALWWAVRLHDWGYVDTVIGHAERSMGIAEPILERLGVPEHIRENALGLIAAHESTGNANVGELRIKVLEERLGKYGVSMPMLTILNVCDVCGMTPKVNKLVFHQLKKIVNLGMQANDIRAHYDEYRLCRMARLHQFAADISSAQKHRLDAMVSKIFGAEENRLRQALREKMDGLNGYIFVAHPLVQIDPTYRLYTKFIKLCAQITEVVGQDDVVVSTTITDLFTQDRTRDVAMAGVAKGMAEFLETLPDDMTVEQLRGMLERNQWKNIGVLPIERKGDAPEILLKVSELFRQGSNVRKEERTGKAQVPEWIEAAYAEHGIVAQIKLALSEASAYSKEEITGQIIPAFAQRGIDLQGYAGFGGYAVTFIGKDRQGQTVAVKVQHPNRTLHNQVMSYYLQMLGAHEHPHLVLPKAADMGELSINVGGSEKKIEYQIRPFVQGQRFDQWLANTSRETVRSRLPQYIRQIGREIILLRFCGLSYNEISQTNTLVNDLGFFLFDPLLPAEIEYYQTNAAKWLNLDITNWLLMGLHDMLETAQLADLDIDPMLEKLKRQKALDQAQLMEMESVVEELAHMVERKIANSDSTIAGKSALLRHWTLSLFPGLTSVYDRWLVAIETSWSLTFGALGLIALLVLAGHFDVSWLPVATKMEMLATTLKLALVAFPVLHLDRLAKMLFSDSKNEIATLPAVARNDVFARSGRDEAISVLADMAQSLPSGKLGRLADKVLPVETTPWGNVAAAAFISMVTGLLWLALPAATGALLLMQVVIVATFFYLFHGTFNDLSERLAKAGISLSEILKFIVTGNFGGLLAKTKSQKQAWLMLGIAYLVETLGATLLPAAMVAMAWFMPGIGLGILALKLFMLAAGMAWVMFFARWMRTARHQVNPEGNPISPDEQIRIERDFLVMGFGAMSLVLAFLLLAQGHSGSVFLQPKFVLGSGSAMLAWLLASAYHAGASEFAKAHGGERRIGIKPAETSLETHFPTLFKPAEQAKFDQLLRDITSLQATKTKPVNSYQDLWEISAAVKVAVPETRYAHAKERMQAELQSRTGQTKFASLEAEQLYVLHEEWEILFQDIFTHDQALAQRVYLAIKGETPGLPFGNDHVAHELANRVESIATGLLLLKQQPRLGNLGWGAYYFLLPSRLELIQNHSISTIWNVAEIETYGTEGTLFELKDGFEILDILQQRHMTSRFTTASSRDSYKILIYLLANYQRVKTALDLKLAPALNTVLKTWFYLLEHNLAMAEFGNLGTTDLQLAVLGRLTDELIIKAEISKLRDKVLITGVMNLVVTDLPDQLIISRKEAVERWMTSQMKAAQTQAGTVLGSGTSEELSGDSEAKTRQWRQPDLRKLRNMFQPGQPLMISIRGKNMADNIALAAVLTHGVLPLPADQIVFVDVARFNRAWILLRDALGRRTPEELSPETQAELQRFFPEFTRETAIAAVTYARQADLGSQMEIRFRNYYFNTVLPSLLEQKSEKVLVLINDSFDYLPRQFENHAAAVWIEAGDQQVVEMRFWQLRPAGGRLGSPMPGEIIRKTLARNEASEAEPLTADQVPLAIQPLALRPGESVLDCSSDPRIALQAAAQGYSVQTVLSQGANQAELKSNGVRILQPTGFWPEAEGICSIDRVSFQHTDTQDLNLVLQHFFLATPKYAAIVPETDATITITGMVHFKPRDFIGEKDLWISLLERAAVPNGKNPFVVEVVQRDTALGGILFYWREKSEKAALASKARKKNRLARIVSFSSGETRTYEWIAAPVFAGQIHIQQTTEGSVRFLQAALLNSGELVWHWSSWENGEQAQRLVTEAGDAARLYYPVFDSQAGYETLVESEQAALAPQNEGERIVRHDSQRSCYQVLEARNWQVQGQTELVWQVIQEIAAPESETNQVAAVTAGYYSGSRFYEVGKCETAPAVEGQQLVRFDSNDNQFQYMIAFRDGGKLIWNIIRTAASIEELFQTRQEQSGNQNAQNQTVMAIDRNGRTVMIKGESALLRFWTLAIFPSLAPFYGRWLVAIETAWSLAFGALGLIGLLLLAGHFDISWLPVATKMEMLATTLKLALIAFPVLHLDRLAKMLFSDSKNKIATLPAVARNDVFARSGRDEAISVLADMAQSLPSGKLGRLADKVLPVETTPWGNVAAAAFISMVTGLLWLALPAATGALLLMQVVIVATFFYLFHGTFSDLSERLAKAGISLSEILKFIVTGNFGGLLAKTKDQKLAWVVIGLGYILETLAATLIPAAVVAIAWFMPGTGAAILSVKLFVLAGGMAWAMYFASWMKNARHQVDPEGNPISPEQQAVIENGFRIMGFGAMGLVLAFLMLTQGFSSGVILHNQGLMAVSTCLPAMMLAMLYHAMASERSKAHGGARWIGTIPPRPDSLEYTLRIYLDVILNENEAHYPRLDAVRRKIFARGPENHLRGQILPEIEYIHEQTGHLQAVDQAKITRKFEAMADACRDQAELLLAPGNKKPDAEQQAEALYRKAAILYFQSLRCARYDRNLQAYTQYLGQQDQTPQIREKLLHALQQQMAQLPEPVVADFRRLWLSDQTRIEDLQAWFTRNTLLQALDYLVDRSDAFWQGYSRWDAVQEACLVLSYLAGQEQGSVAQKERNSYLNSRRLEAGAKLDEKVMDNIAEVYRGLLQNGQDRTIVKLLFLSVLLKDYARLLLGDDAKDAQILLPGILKQLQLEDEEAEMVLLLCSGHRSHRMLSSGDGEGPETLTRQFLVTARQTQQEENVPDLATEPGPLAQVRQALGGLYPGRSLSQLYSQGVLTQAMNYLRMLDRKKSPGMTIVQHTLSLNDYLAILEHEDQVRFEQQRQGPQHQYIAPQQIQRLHEAVDEVGRFLVEKLGVSVSEARIFLHAVALVHDFGDVFTYGDHALRGAGMLPAVFAALGITHPKLIQYGQFLVAYHPELGGIYNGERTPHALQAALAGYAHDEQGMLTQFLAVLNSVDILSVRDGSLFTPGVAEFMLGCIDDPYFSRFADETAAATYRLQRFCSRVDGTLDLAKWHVMQQRLRPALQDEGFCRFLATVRLDHAMDVFVYLQVDDILKLLRLFYAMQQASVRPNGKTGQVLAAFDFTASRSIAGLSRQFVSEMLSIDERVLEEKSLDFAQSLLKSKGLIVHAQGDTLYLDNRYLIQVNRYFKAAAILDLVYYAGRGAGTLTNRLLKNFIYLAHLGNVQELSILERAWPVVRLWYGFLGSALRSEKEFDLEAAGQAVHQTYLVQQPTPQACLELLDTLQPAEPGTVKEEYWAALAELQAIHAQGKLGLFLEFLQNKTIRLRNVTSHVRFGGAGLVKFLYALALLWEKAGKQHKAYLFDGEYRGTISAENIPVMEQSIETIREQAADLAPEDFCLQVLGLSQPAGFWESPDMVVVNLQPTLQPRLLGGMMPWLQAWYVQRGMRRLPPTADEETQAAELLRLNRQYQARAWWIEGVPLLLLGVVLAGIAISLGIHGNWHWAWQTANTKILGVGQGILRSYWVLFPVFHFLKNGRFTWSKLEREEKINAGVVAVLLAAINIGLSFTSLSAGSLVLTGLATHAAASLGLRFWPGRSIPVPKSARMDQTVRDGINDEITRQIPWPAARQRVVGNFFDHPAFFLRPLLAPLPASADDQSVIQFIERRFTNPRHAVLARDAGFFHGGSYAKLSEDLKRMVRKKWREHDGRFTAAYLRSGQGSVPYSLAMLLYQTLEELYHEVEPQHTAEGFEAWIKQNWNVRIMALDDNLGNAIRCRAGVFHNNILDEENKGWTSLMREFLYYHEPAGSASGYFEIHGLVKEWVQAGYWNPEQSGDLAWFAGQKHDMIFSGDAMESVETLADKRGILDMLIQARHGARLITDNFTLDFAQDGSVRNAEGPMRKRRRLVELLENASGHFGGTQNQALEEERLAGLVGQLALLQPGPDLQHTLEGLMAKDVSPELHAHLQWLLDKARPPMEIVSVTQQVAPSRPSNFPVSAVVQVGVEQTDNKTSSKIALADLFIVGALLLAMAVVGFEIVSHSAGWQPGNRVWHYLKAGAVGVAANYFSMLIVRLWRLQDLSMQQELESRNLFVKIHGLTHWLLRTYAPGLNREPVVYGVGILFSAGIGILLGFAFLSSALLGWAVTGILLLVWAGIYLVKIEEKTEGKQAAAEPVLALRSHALRYSPNESLSQRQFDRQPWLRRWIIMPALGMVLSLAVAAQALGFPVQLHLSTTQAMQANQFGFVRKLKISHGLEAGWRAAQGLQTGDLEHLADKIILQAEDSQASGLALGAAQATINADGALVIKVPGRLLASLDYSSEQAGLAAKTGIEGWLAMVAERQLQRIIEHQTSAVAARVRAGDQSLLAVSAPTFASYLLAQMSGEAWPSDFARELGLVNGFWQPIFTRLAAAGENELPARLQVLADVERYLLDRLEAGEAAMQAGEASPAQQENYVRNLVFLQEWMSLTHPPEMKRKILAFQPKGSTGILPSRITLPLAFAQSGHKSEQVRWLALLQKHGYKIISAYGKDFQRRRIRRSTASSA